MPDRGRLSAPAMLVYSPASAFASYHSGAIILSASVATFRSERRTGPGRDGRPGPHCRRCEMSLTELLLLAIGALIFAAALSLVIGIGSRLITVA
jgi:hypothetical protein